MVKDPLLEDRHCSQSLRIEVTTDGKDPSVGDRHCSQSLRIDVTTEGETPLDTDIIHYISRIKTSDRRFEMRHLSRSRKINVNIPGENP